MSEVIVALGSNVGDSLRNLRLAAELMAREVAIVAASRIYRTAPMYVVDQPDFLNAAVLVRTVAGPLPLLGMLKAIEADIGRRSGQRYGPREIDLDLVSYGSLVYRFREKGKVVLQVPHPKTPERRFVLAPIADLGPEILLPGLGRVSALLDQTKDQSGCVQVIADALL